MQRTYGWGLMLAVATVATILGGCHKGAPGTGGAGTPPPTGLTALARSAPGDAPVFVAVDMRGKTTMADQVARLQAAADKSPTLKQGIDGMERKLGISLNDIAACTAPAGFVVVMLRGQPGLANEDKAPDVVVALAVTDPKAAEAIMLKLQAGTSHTATMGKTASCESNLKNLGTALEMYSTDNSGRYATNLAQLTPNYLKVIPTCPAAGSDTYTATFTSASNPDAYTLYCTGDHHGMGNQLPAYNSTQGLVVGEVKVAATPEAVVSPTPVFKSVTVAGTQVWVSPESDKMAYVIHGGYLLFGNGADALGRVLQTLDGQGQTLAAAPQFAEARKQMPGDDGALAFVALSGTIGQVMALPNVKSHTDEQTTAALSAIQYLCTHVSMGPEGLESDLFVKVDPTSQSPFIKALLAGPAPDASLARYFPAKWSNYNSSNINWIYHVAIEAVRLVPSLRPQVDALPAMAKMQTGLDLEQDVLGATNGGFAQASNWPQELPNLLSGNFASARGQGEAVSCESNEKNIGTALEMYSTDNSGRYPHNLSKLTPDYLKVIPTCPGAGKDTYSSTYKYGTSPDAYSFYCKGENHTSSGVPANYPKYNSTVGLDSPQPRSTGPRIPPITTIVAVHLKTPEAGFSLAQKLEARANVKSTVVHKVGDVEIHGYQQIDFVRWAIATTPDAVMLVSFGPKAEEWLETALSTPSQAGTSVADQPEYKAMMQQAGSLKVVSSDFTDLTPLFNAVGDMLDANTRTMPGNDAVQLVAASLKNAQSVKGVSYMEVLPDGLHFVGRGNGSSTMLTFGAAVGAAILVPNFVRARSQGQLSSCESNCKNIGTALEMYSTDNEGRYPRPGHMDALTPNYLRVIPTCPSAGIDTYSGDYQSASSPDAYTFYCNGTNHTALVPPSYPQYNSAEGLVSGH